MKIPVFVLSAALLIAPAFANAQTPTAQHRTIQQRKVEQQRRIAQGVHSGQLTRGETRRLEKQQHAIHREERAMRSQDNGRLTRQDRKTIRKQQNQESRRIYRSKHNSKTAG